MSNQYTLHGGEVYSLARAMHTSPEKLLDFSSNANIFAYALTAELVKSTPYSFLHYPDSNCPELREAIAAHENLLPSTILPGNGAAELIWIFLQQMAPRHVLFIGPIFSEYCKACKALGISFSILTPPESEHFGLGAQELNTLWENDADLVILCTPNNPAAITYPNFYTVLNMLRSPRVLIDNSYKEFLHGTPEYRENSYNAYLQHIRPGVSLFTLNSFTKFFCSPGIRLGYLLGERKHIERLSAQRPSWMVNPFAQQMGVSFLDTIEAYRNTLHELRQATVATAREFRQNPLFSWDLIYEGAGFLLCGLQKRFNAERLYQDLLGFGIIVRSCDTIPGMPMGYIRVQARPLADREKLFEALDNIARQWL